MYNTTVLANRIHTYEFWLKGIDTPPPLKLNVEHTSYKPGDVVWVKMPSNKCTSKLCKGKVNRIIIDGV